MKTLISALTLFLSQFASAVATGIEGLEWHPKFSNGDNEVITNRVPESLHWAFRYGQETPTIGLYYPSREMSSPLQSKVTITQFEWNDAAGMNMANAIDIASINFVIPKENNVRFEKGTVFWELRI